jgi:hypothetical protein
MTISRKHKELKPSAVVAPKLIRSRTWNFPMDEDRPRAKREALQIAFYRETSIPSRANCELGNRLWRSFSMRIRKSSSCSGSW